MGKNLMGNINTYSDFLETCKYSSVTGYLLNFSIYYMYKINHANEKVFACVSKYEKGQDAWLMEL